jgi:hypothetical protein
MNIKTFVDSYKAKKFMNIKTAAEEKSEWLRNELEIKTYIPFKKKREIAEMIVEQNMSEVDGIKKYDDINSYVSLVVASIVAHTNLKFGSDPIEDYDLLAEAGLLSQIIAEFQGSHEEIGIVLKMAVAAELEDNNTNVTIGQFLDSILKKLEKLDLKKLFGAEIKDEDLTQLKGFLDRFK